jgi:hypothetical protein
MLSIAQKHNENTGKHNNLPPEIIDEILLWVGDIRLIYGLGKFSLMSRFMPQKFRKAMGRLYIKNLKHLSETYDSKMRARDANLIDWAAASGRLRYLKYLTENTNLVGTSDSMDAAATYGHFGVVKYLHQTRNEGCTKNAMDCAAWDGYFEIIQFLHVNRAEGCTALAMDFAAGLGNFELVKFLHENRKEGCTLDGVSWAFDKGYLRIAAFMREHYFKNSFVS